MSPKAGPGKTAALRKRRFFAALSLAGLTQNEWAERQGITDTHVYHVLSGKRESASLIAKIDAFIAEQLEAASAA